MSNGQYKYMQELALLDCCRPGAGEMVPNELRASLAEVRTPLEVTEWKKALRTHPDGEFVHYLLKGISQGFRIGFKRELVRLNLAKRNMASASAEPAAIEAYLAKERAAGRIAGPFEWEGVAASSIHTSRFGVIPKPHQPGSSIHYLDDFLFVGPLGTGECGVSLQLAERICKRLGVPLAVEKREGPAQVLVFLGIILDSVRMELRLPEEKLQRMPAMVEEWLPRRSCTKKELLSLIGHLQHAARIVKPGRPFLRRMIDLSSSTQELHHHIRLRGEFKSDLQWWLLFMERWNGVSMMSSLGWATPEVVLTSDASGHWGCGAFLASGEWFQLRWRGEWQEVHITAKELLPIVMACAMWAGRWRSKTVKCLCDNAAVVAIIRVRTEQASPGDASDAYNLSLFTARHNVAIIAEHLPGKENGAADALSRGNLDLFFRQVPTANKDPAAIPQELLDVLVHQQPDWTSATWRKQWAVISQWV